MADPIPNVDRAPSTEEEILAARIGPPTVLNGPIRLVETIIARARVARDEQ